MSDQNPNKDKELNGKSKISKPNQQQKISEFTAAVDDADASPDAPPIVLAIDDVVDQEAPPIVSADDELAESSNPNQQTMTTKTKKSFNNKGKKASLNPKLRNLAKKKLLSLESNFRPVPFGGASHSFDLAKHENLLRALDLWEFAQIEFGRVLRTDLLADLIAYYDPVNRRSFVLGRRIKVSRCDLARALKLSSAKVKKEKPGCLEIDIVDPKLELYLREESVVAIMDFVLSFMMLQIQEDECLLPIEYSDVQKLVKEGQPHKVDWAGFIWGFVEKELRDAPVSGNCYFASLLQCLLRFQHPELFEEDEEPKVETVPEAENSADVVVAEDEDMDETCQDGITMARNEDFGNSLTENYGAGLSLCIGRELGDVDHAVMNGVVECSDGVERQWLHEDKNGGIEHCMRRCNSNLMGSLEFDNFYKDTGVGREEEGFNDVFARISSLDSMNTTGLIQTMDSMHTSYNQQVNSVHLSSGDFLAMKVDNQKNLELDQNHSGSIFYGNNGKRPINDVDEDEDEDDDNDGDNGQNVHQFPQYNQQKRMRSSVMWEQTPNFEDCMELVDCTFKKSKILFAQKEEELLNVHRQVQMLHEYKQERDQIIQTMERTGIEERQRMLLESHRYEHELTAMANLVIGYKKALKQTQVSFEEYRKKFGQGDESIYRDVAGSGELVLTAKESGSLRQEKQEEMRCKLKETFDTFEKAEIAKFDESMSQVEVLISRVTKLSAEFALLKENSQKLQNPNV